MSNSTQFKAGQQVIVLPFGSQNSTYDPFEVVKISSIEDMMHPVRCKRNKDDYTQVFDFDQLQPLPIPYYLLDAE